MRLKSIELQGFKSFVDRTRLEFDEGITAILGPNGCGKSNVVDAVRWVLGEQSAKTLRGGKMDDVIFKGTTKRRPVGMAEVTLVFDNEDRGLPIDFSEVAIKRRVTRDGGSDYFLNNTLCRLKDLRDLFFDSGVNNTSYSIIEESMIKQILNENNHELRNLLEEGSGITKYKARRKETQRKLDRTQHDLTRLYDIIEEIGREVRSLKYQVGKARRHQKLFKEIRNLDLLVAAKHHADLRRQDTEARDFLENYKTEAEVGVGELAELRARIESARPQIDEREAERRQLEEALTAFEEELQETERKVLVLQHRIEEHERRNSDNTQAIGEAEIKQKGIEGQIDRLSEHLQTLEEELISSRKLLDERTESLQVLDERLTTDRTSLDEATRLNLEFIENDATHRSKLRELQVKQENRRERIGILEEDREAILVDGQAAEKELAALAERQEEQVARRRELLKELADNEHRESDLEALAGDLQESVTNLSGRREALRSTLELLQRLQDEYEGYGQGAREILQRHGGESRITGGLADLLQVPDADTAALETLLAERLDAVVVDGADTALNLVGELRQEQLGQARFLCGEGFNTVTDGPSTGPEGGRQALDVVTGRGTEVPALRRLLARTWLFDDDQAAVHAAAGFTGQDIVFCVSRTGLLACSDGTIGGGRREKTDSSLLGRQAKLEELTAEAGRLDEKVTRAQEKVALNRTQREELREALIMGRGRLAEFEEALSQLQVTAAQLQHRRDTAGQRAEEMAAERARLAEDVAQLADEEQTLVDRLSQTGKEREDSTMRRAELRQRVEEAEMARDEARGQTEELRLTHQRRESQKRETETTIAHLRENVAEQLSRRERLAEEIEVGKESIGALGEELEKKRDMLGKAMEERGRRRQILRAAADGIQAMHEETAVWHERAQDIEKRRGSYREQAHEMETKLATLEIKLNNLEERIEEQYQGRFQELIASINEEDLPRELERDGDVFQLSQADELLDLKRSKLNSLGPINHLALDEYETKAERLDFLEKQRDDVEKARDDLVKAINEINRTARKRFVDTFEEVRRNYIAVFQTLFKGGRADLQLIRTDDPLESHVHVLAQPTGKVINTVSLLSGGERCLTALSLLFAVYLVKPSPFCMLDEADAPLDDVNIGRYVNMLREFSRNTQFLVITHNKLTMETANHLYGVTMMEPGCSSIVSVSFHDVAETQNDQDLGNAIARRRLSVDDDLGAPGNDGLLDDGQEDMDFSGEGLDEDADTDSEDDVKTDGHADAPVDDKRDDSEDDGPDTLEASQ